MMLPPTLTELIPVVDGLSQEIRLLLHQGEPQSVEIAAAKALEIARYCARTATAMQPKCPVISRAEIDQALREERTA